MNTMDINVALFGEAEKGEFHTPYFCENLSQLVEYLGHPPIESKGLFFAVQALLFRRKILFFRVQEEGFSEKDYYLGVELLAKRRLIPNLAAIAIPGVGNAKIIHALEPVCEHYHSILVTTEADLFDYLNDAA